MRFSIPPECSWILQAQFDMIGRRRAYRGHTESSKCSPAASRRPFRPHISGRLPILLLALAASFAPARSQQGGPIKITVSDELTECVPTNITWTGGTPPYTLGIGYPNFNHGPKEEYTNISRTFFVWSTDVAAESSVVFAVGDGASITYSGFADINAGLTESCIPEPSATSGGASLTTTTQDSAGGTNAATPGTSSTSSSSSSLSPDVIGIIVAVAVALLILVIWVLYKRSAWSKRGQLLNVNSNASTPPAAAPGPAAPNPYPAPNPPTSPTVRATSILSPSPDYSPVASPPLSALQFAPYGYSPPPPPPPAWQAMHTSQTHFVGSPALAPVMSHDRPGWNSVSQDTYTGMTQTQTRWQEGLALPATITDGDGGARAQTVASTEGGSESWRDNALLAVPQSRWT